MANPPFVLTADGIYSKTERWLRGLHVNDLYADLDHYGRLGVDALAMATPVDTGLAASSWYYQIIDDRSGPTLSWFNDDIEGGFSVVIGIQYGHGTRGGTYVQGRDFINPAIKPIFDSIAQDIWKKVSA
jgi:hypothetical protein